MTFIRYLKSLDSVTKVGVVVLFMLALYFFFLITLKPFFVPSSESGMFEHMMSFANSGQKNLNLASLFFVVLGGLLFWLIIKRVAPSPTEPSQGNELTIIKKALSADEKKILEEVEKAGEITQDSLRYRLQWSKAKVSALLLQLDRLGLVQRQREGKTYRVFLQKK